jgi:hypothetical protein
VAVAVVVAGWQWIDSARVAVALLHKCFVCFSSGVNGSVSGSVNGSGRVAVTVWQCCSYIFIVYFVFF